MEITPQNIVTIFKVGYNISVGGGYFEFADGHDFRRIPEKSFNATTI